MDELDGECLLLEDKQGQETKGWGMRVGEYRSLETGIRP